MRTVLSVLALAAAAPALGAPLSFTHQGRLLDSSGVPLDGSHTVTFSLYAEPSGGTAVWAASRDLALDGGYYTTELGATEALDSALFTDHDALYLGIAVLGDPELAPRLPVVSVPWAVVARHAENVVGGTVEASEVVVGGQTVIGTDGRVAWDRLSGVPDDPLTALGCADDQVAIVRSGGWTCLDADDHAHRAEDVTSGILDVGRLPVGIGSNTVAAGDHDHDADYLPNAVVPRELLPVGTGTDQVAAGEHTHDYAALTGAPDRSVLPWNDGTSRETAAASCLAISERDPSLPSGRYWLDPDGGARSNAFQASCDMEYDGGGWTLVGLDVTGDTGPGRLVSSSPVWGTEVATCESVERSWTDSCWRIHRGLVTNHTEVLFKAGRNVLGDATAFDSQLAFAKGRIQNRHPDTLWTMLVANQRWDANQGQLYNFDTGAWDTVPDGNINHHGQIYWPSSGWIHWNVADIQRAGGQQLASWTRNDVPEAYFDPEVGDRTNRASNDSGVIIELWVRGR